MLMVGSTAGARLPLCEPCWPEPRRDDRGAMCPCCDSAVTLLPSAPVADLAPVAVTFAESGYCVSALPPALDQAEARTEYGRWCRGWRPFLVRLSDVTCCNTSSCRTFRWTRRRTMEAAAHSGI